MLCKETIELFQKYLMTVDRSKRPIWAQGRYYRREKEGTVCR